MKRRILFASKFITCGTYEDIINLLERGEAYKLIEIDKDKVNALLPILLENVEKYGSYMFLDEDEYKQISEL